MKTEQVIILGAGAAGLFCAFQAAQRGKRVLVLDGANKAGKKILMSGGGRCNFTNRDVQPKHFISQNTHFCRSALARYRPEDFIALVEAAGIAYEERDLGKLFCQHSAKDLLDMLLGHCQRLGVRIELNRKVESVEHRQDLFCIKAGGQHYAAEQLVVATGGLSIPTLGASGIGFDIGRQFGHQLVPTRAGLVPLTWPGDLKARFAELSGISLTARVTCESGQQFTEPVLLTHRGLSGPAILQISNYWQPGQSLELDWLPETRLGEHWQSWQQQQAKAQLGTLLGRLLPSRLVQCLAEGLPLDRKLAEQGKATRQAIEQWHHWSLQPSGSEGWRTAEVTLGGIDCQQLSSKSMASTLQPGLYFIGEVVDVTGWLGGYNFQWAWASAFCCAEHL